MKNDLILCKWLPALALLLLAACDGGDRREFRRDRAEREYKAAMTDYQAGRLDAAIEGMLKTLRKDPANASARFMLACLLHDAKSDYAGAFCAYREYLIQRPDSDKASMAAERMGRCEQEMARELAEKYGLADKTGLSKDNDALKAEIEALKRKIAEAAKDAETLRSRIGSLSGERDRLLAIIKGGHGAEASSASAPSLTEVKDLLEEESEDRISTSEDAKLLRMETDAELSSGSSLLPPKPAGGAAKAEPAPEKPAEPASAPVPEFHVVQEGDTLYGIAKRYYGRISMWKRIREANKELISADSRLRVGDKLRLPK